MLTSVADRQTLGSVPRVAALHRPPTSHPTSNLRLQVHVPLPSYRIHVPFRTCAAFPVQKRPPGRRWPVIGSSRARVEVEAPCPSPLSRRRLFPQDSIHRNRCDPPFSPRFRFSAGASGGRRGGPPEIAGFTSSRPAAGHHVSSSLPDIETSATRACPFTSTSPALDRNQRPPR